MDEPIQKAEGELTKEVIHQMLRLKCLVWPEKYSEATYDQHWKEFPAKRAFCSGREFVLIYDGDTLIAQAEQFPRTIKSEKSVIPILALAGVAVHPGYRRKGLGRRLLTPIFARVDRGDYTFCLFQTPVPDFYAHLGCVVVEDTFYNGHPTAGGEESIWWEEYVMIYPSNRPWLSGPVDLNGPAY